MVEWLGTVKPFNPNKENLVKTRADLILETQELLRDWLASKQQQGRGECTQQEWETFLIMERRSCTWNRRLLSTYCDYLRCLPVDGDILLNRPQVYTLGTYSRGVA